jgi:uncharacterized membrane protein
MNSFQAKYAVGMTAYAVIVIALLATGAVPPIAAGFFLFGGFAAVFLGAGLFILVDVYRRRAVAVPSTRWLIVGVGVFYLLIGALGCVTVVAPFTGHGKSAFLVIGLLFVARGIAARIALWVMKRRGNSTTA